MARGDVKLFASFLQKSKGGVAFNLATDAVKLGIVTSATVPTVGTADPRWGAGGSTNFATNQVPTGTAYVTGGPTLGSPTYVQSAGVDTYDAADVTIAQDGTGFTTGAYGILYDSTVAGNYAIGFVDLGGPVGIQSGPLQIVWNAAGIFTETAA